MESSSTSGNQSEPFIFRMKAEHLFCLLVIGLTLIRLVALVCAPINQDEGWYVLGSRNLANGLTPYGDFAFTQGPFFLWIYGFTQPVWQTLTGARLLTTLFGLLTIFPAAYIAGKLCGSQYRIHSWNLLALFVGWNLFQAENSVVVKTYALAGLLLTGGLALLVKAISGSNKNALLTAVVAGALIAASAGVRISLGAALPIIVGYLLFKRRSFGSQLWWAFALGAGVVLLSQFGWAWISGGSAWIENQFGYHLSREGFTWSGKLVGIGGHLSRLASHYILPIVVLCFLLIYRPRSGSGGEGESKGVPGLLVAALAFPLPPASVSRSVNKQKAQNYDGQSIMARQPGQMPSYAD